MGLAAPLPPPPRGCSAPLGLAPRWPMAGRPWQWERAISDSFYKQKFPWKCSLGGGETRERVQPPLGASVGLGPLTPSRLQPSAPPLAEVGNAVPQEHGWALWCGQDPVGRGWLAGWDKCPLALSFSRLPVQCPGGSPGWVPCSRCWRSLTAWPPAELGYQAALVMPTTTPCLLPVPRWKSLCLPAQPALLSVASQGLGLGGWGGRDQLCRAPTKAWPS